MSVWVCESLCFGDVLKDVSLTLERGRVCALVGPSGAGKTTLLWVMAGLWETDGGRVTRGPGRLGMVFQQPGLWDHLTVEQHLKLVGADRGQRERAMERMRLTDLRRRRPGRMSGGERQRLSIARALAVEPAWLLLDEPMAHLDGPARSALFDLLRDALAGSNAGVLLATHHAVEAMRLADETAVLIDGRLVQHGPTEEVYRQPVDLAAACATGMASEVDGRIARPEQLIFTADPAGNAVVRRCEFAGSCYLLRVETGCADATVRCQRAVAPGTTGRLKLTP
jgi:ABC-type multidrug transport system ATPase subunit